MGAVTPATAATSDNIAAIEKALEGELSRSENAFQPQPMEAPMRRDELKQKAIEQFTDYFVKNYPGPDTIIYDPKWHAPKIFAAAFRAITAALEVEQPVAAEWRWFFGQAEKPDILAFGPDATTTEKSCERCQGNGEIVTDWERYRRPHDGDVGDEAVAECPDCGGEGIIDVGASPTSTSGTPIRQKSDVPTDVNDMPEGEKP